MIRLITINLALIFSLNLLNAQNAQPPKIVNTGIPELVLTFTKTNGFRHQNIKKGVKTLRGIGRENGFIVLQTESPEDFNPENLKNYRLVVFLNTSGDVLNTAQQQAFESYIKNGGAFLGIHGAAATEYDWAWYGKLVGGYLDQHPKDPSVRQATIKTLDNAHPATAHLPANWERSDEWYNFKNLNPNTTKLLNLDESTYQVGSQGSNHPIAWYHEFGGGRAFYTAGGHTEATFDEPLFKQHLLGAMEWCLGRK